MPSRIVDLEVVDMLCRAALEPDLWPAALSSLLPHFRSKHVSFYTCDETADEGVQLVHSGFSDAELKIQFSPEAMRCWNNFRPHFSAGKFITNRHIISERDWERSEAYNEYVRHSGVYHGALLQQNSPETSFCFAICRPGAGDPYTDDELALLQSLTPHITRSLRLKRRLEIVEQRTTILNAALDGLDQGVIAVNAKGMPLVANARAQAMLDRGDALMNGALGLRTHRPALTKSLHDAIRTVSDPRWTGDLHLSLPRKKPLLPLLLEVVSITRLDADLHGAGRASALIFIREPAAPLVINRQAVVDTFHFTPRETDVAILLAEGLGTESIAAKTGIAVGTVRFHLKRMFQKANVGSQAALVSLLHGFSARRQ